MDFEWRVNKVICKTFFVCNLTEVLKNAAKSSGVFYKSELCFSTAFFSFIIVSIFVTLFFLAFEHLSRFRFLSSVYIFPGICFFVAVLFCFILGFAAQHDSFY
jgi:hypothetical protein